MGISANRRVQVAPETVKFTAEEALYRLVGQEPDLVFDPTFESIGGYMGGFARTSKWYIAGRAGTGSLKGPLLRDVEGLIPFVHGMRAYERTGVSTPYSYAFVNEFEPAASPDIPTLTMEYGDKTEFLLGIGGIVTGITLTFEVNKAVQVDANLAFGDVTDALTAFTAITAGTPDYSDASRRPPVVLTNNMHLLVDGVDVGVDFIGGSLTINTGNALDPRVDGTPATNSIVYGIPEIEGSFTLETGTDEAAWLGHLLGESAHVYTIQDHASAPTFSVSFTGQPAAVGTIGDSNGVSSIPFTVRDIYRPDLQADPLTVTMVTTNASYA